MSSSSNATSPPHRPPAIAQHAQNVLLWIGLIVLAVVPIPWW